MFNKLCSDSPRLVLRSTRFKSRPYYWLFSVTFFIVFLSLPTGFLQSVITTVLQTVNAKDRLS